MKLYFTAIAIVLLTGLSGIYAKRPLNHDDFDRMLSVNFEAMTRDGSWIAFGVNPQEGDGTLTFRDTRNGKEITLPRGHKPAFTADGKWAAAMIRPFFADTRKGKIDKKKDFDLPQDSLAIIDLTTGHIEKVAHVIRFSLGEKGGRYLAYQSSDTLHIKKSDLKDKESGKPLIIRSLTSPESKTVKWVKDFAFSKDGRRLALNIKKGESDTLSTDGIMLVNLYDRSMQLIDRDKHFYSLPVFNEDASMLAYTASADTAKSGTLHTKLYLAEISDANDYGQIQPVETDLIFPERPPVNLMPARSDNPEEQAILDKKRSEEIAKSMGEILRLNQYSTPEFSRNGRYLSIGVAPIIAPDDTTIVDFEQAEIDIWRWDAPYTVPQEKSNIENLRKNSVPVIIDLKNGNSQTLLSRNLLADFDFAEHLDGDWALIHDPSKEFISRQWNYMAPEDLIMVNVATGERRNVTTAAREASALSPDGRFTVWFADRQYHAYDVSTGKSVVISSGIDFPLWDEDSDVPMAAEAYGIAGWGRNDNRVLVYDRYDIWSLDLTGASKPQCLTSGDGRKNGLSYRYLQLDKDNRTIKPGQTMVLSVFNHADKRNGLASINYGKPTRPNLRVLEEFSFNGVNKAENSDTYSFKKGNFNTIPELWIATSPDFSKAKKVTDVNSCIKDISLGSAHLFKWNAYDGSPSEGVVYLPEDFDPEGSYPLMTVFYERNSENLYQHYTIQPSWSWVNYPFYASRGYIVFVPDIRYTTGLPGESAYNYVCSGVEELCKEYPAIDKKRIGIDGQSWGGYQTAYLVTRTDMFACAGSGAPVANMTSAFGGIRWGSGDSRQAQYECGQSRIGRNLWDAPELYIANSPLFHADRVKTPLLIMHNDNDGAVPWYQGIEMFMALRRLQKPVWMLQYNGEAHNIKARKNRKDITHRLQEFFDHYLKGYPMPRWMREGISPLRKGQDLGY